MVSHVWVVTCGAKLALPLANDDHNRPQYGRRHLGLGKDLDTAQGCATGLQVRSTKVSTTQTTPGIVQSPNSN